MKTIKKIQLVVLLMLLYSVKLYAGGEIKGTVKDSLTNQPVVMAMVTIISGPLQKGSYTDDEGNFVIKPLDPGIYKVVVSYMGYNTLTFENVQVFEGQIAYVNAVMTNGVVLTSIKIDGTAPIINPWGYLPRKDATQLERSPYAKQPIEMIAMTPAVVKSERGNDLYFRGSRAGSSIFFVDGEKLIGELTIPGGSIADMTIYTGGTPAQYGDFTGGAVVITTKSYLSEMARRRILYGDLEAND